MICKKLSVVALSGLTAALSLSAMAQDTASSSSTTSSSTTSSTTTTGDMSGGMSGSGSGSMAMSMEPTQVTGTVQRYYTDRSGYVTAMDVQTAEGTRMVRFSPGMAQRLYSTYPVGGQITGTIQPSMSGGTARYDLMAMGDQMPAAGMMKPNMISDTEVLKSDPFIMAGSGLIQFSGKLKSVITDDEGEVLALVLSGVKMPGQSGMMEASMSGGMSGGAMSGGMSGGGMSGGAMSGDTSSGTMSTSGTMDSAAMGGMSGGMSGGGMMEDLTLVRVPRELRHNTGAQYAGSSRVSPLFNGAKVEVVGYNEAPRYGVVSAFSNRVAANALVINGRAVGAVGLPRVLGKSGGMKMSSSGGTMSAEETSAMGMGYSTYGMSTGGDMSGGMTTGSDPSMTTGTTGATGGTSGGSTTGTTGGM